MYIRACIQLLKHTHTHRVDTGQKSNAFSHPEIQLTATKRHCTNTHARIHGANKRHSQRQRQREGQRGQAFVRTSKPGVLVICAHTGSHGGFIVQFAGHTCATFVTLTMPSRSAHSSRQTHTQRTHHRWDFAPHGYYYYCMHTHTYTHECRVFNESKLTLCFASSNVWRRWHFRSLGSAIAFSWPVWFWPNPVRHRLLCVPIDKDGRINSKLLLDAVWRCGIDGRQYSRDSTT